MWFVIILLVVAVTLITVFKIFFSDNEALTFVGIFLSIFSFVILITAIIAPIATALETDNIARKYYTYANEYLVYQSGGTDRVSYTSEDLITLQTKIDSYNEFRKNHPMLSFYLGHQLDDLYTINFVIDKNKKEWYN